jgi:hypothetical protein
MLALTISHAFHAPPVPPRIRLRELSRKATSQPSSSIFITAAKNRIEESASLVMTVLVTIFVVSIMLIAIVAALLRLVATRPGGPGFSRTEDARNGVSKKCAARNA